MSIPFCATLSFVMTTCIDKQKSLVGLFISYSSAEEKYTKIIEFGRSLPLYPSELKTNDRIVTGCQSILYLHTHFEEGRVYYQATSEALISAGLAALLIHVYGGEKSETILQCPPHFIKEINFQTLLTPGRSNGLASMFARMQKDVIKFLAYSLQ